MGFFDFFVDIGFLFLLASLILAFLLIMKSSHAKNLKERIKALENSLNQLDEQAKLIIQTDLHQSKTQEALDGEIEVLYALNKLTRLIGATLDEKAIFKNIDTPLLYKLGFEKILIITNENNELTPRVKMGFSFEGISAVKKDITAIYDSLLKNKKPICIPNIDDADSNFKSIMKNLGLDSLIAVSITAKENPMGQVIVGNKIGKRAFVAGDVEVISILSNQIAQSIENIKLYEEAWGAQQGLELRVKDRTKNLTSALNTLQRISKAKSEFVSAVSHELRTPLTSIKGYASILSSGKLGKINDEVKRRLEKINKHSDALTNLINELLDISRIESGRTIMKYEDFSLAKLLDSLADILGPQLKEKEITLEIEIPKALTLHADKSQIERVFLNLSSNALKFTPAKGKISIVANEDKNQISIKVSDTGKGIAENDLPHIFDEFYRADNEVNAQIKGTGLGLSLVKSIVDAHKGILICESKLDRGTVFSIKLPKE